MLCQLRSIKWCVSCKLTWQWKIHQMYFSVYIICHVSSSKGKYSSFAGNNTYHIICNSQFLHPLIEYLPIASIYGIGIFTYIYHKSQPFMLVNIPVTWMLLALYNHNFLKNNPSWELPYPYPGPACLESIIFFLTKVGIKRGKGIRGVPKCHPVIWEWCVSETTAITHQLKCEKYPIIYQVFCTSHMVQVFFSNQQYVGADPAKFSPSVLQVEMLDPHLMSNLSLPSYVCSQLRLSCREIETEEKFQPSLFTCFTKKDISYGFHFLSISLSLSLSSKKKRIRPCSNSLTNTFLA